MYKYTIGLDWAKTKSTVCVLVVSHVRDSYEIKKFLNFRCSIKTLVQRCDGTKLLDVPGSGF